MNRDTLLSSVDPKTVKAVRLFSAGDPLYNPLTLYGEDSGGKSSLLAYLELLLRRHPDRPEILCFDAPSLPRFFHSSRGQRLLREGNEERPVFILCDKLEQMAALTQSQQRLCLLLDEREQRRLHFIFSAERPPREIANCSRRLVIHLVSGYPIRMNAPATSSSRAPSGVKDFQEATAAYFSLPAAEIFSCCKKPRPAHARQLFIYAMTNHFAVPREELTRYCRLPPPSYGYAIRKVEAGLRREGGQGQLSGLINRLTPLFPRRPS